MIHITIVRFLLFQYEECATHRDNLRYCCSTCGQQLCSLCLHSGHPQDHNVKLTCVFVQEEKLNLEKNIKKASKDYEKQKTKLREDIFDIDTRMKDLFQGNASMHSIAANIDDLLPKIQMAKDITSIKHLEKAVGDFCSAVGDCCSAKTMVPSGKEAMAGITNDSGKEAAEPARENAPLDQQQQSSAPSQQKPKPTHTQGAMMDFRDGRLLLHCLAEPRSTRLSLQVCITAHCR